MSDYKCLIDDRQGNAYELPIEEARWTTQRVGSPGRLEFSYLRGSGVDVRNGHIARLDAGGRTVFYGYAFSVRHGEDEVRQVTCYDQVRYMLFEETYVFENSTASQMLRMMAEDVGLNLGVVEETGYAMNLALENKKLLDILYEALDTTLDSTGRDYTLFDDGGLLCLKGAEGMRTDLLLGDGSLAYGYSHALSIDKETYDRIKIMRKNQRSGQWDVFIYQDEGSIARWGTLQRYEIAEESATDAQIASRGQSLLALGNRESREFSLRALGDVRARAGAGVYIAIGDEGIGGWYTVEGAEHVFKQGSHEMNLRLTEV